MLADLSHGDARLHAPLHKPHVQLDRAPFTAELLMQPDVCLHKYKHDRGTLNGAVGCMPRARFFLECTMQPLLLRL